MWWPIRNQILLPFTLILLAAVAVTSLTSSIFAARRAEQAILGQFDRIVGTLGPSGFPWSANVLEMMRGLSGAEFILLDDGNRPIATTVGSLDQLGETSLEQAAKTPWKSLRSAPTMIVADERFFATAVSRPRTAAIRQTLLVLYPVETWERARWEAATPPLLVGAGTLGLLTVASVWLASRLGNRIHRVQQQVARIADGDFQVLEEQQRRDEIRDLAASVNRMARQLQDQDAVLRRTERTRLLGQVAGGIAHQLRNAATGARMAVQIHLRRCQPPATDDSLFMALRQLELMEEQVRGLLSLGRTERRPPVDRTLGALLSDVEALVTPPCRHHSIHWTMECAANTAEVIHDSDGLRTALVNLVLNAIEAAGPSGRVEMTVTSKDGLLTFDVSDNGPGPPPEIADQLFDLFVTDKPEGVGFGLALARQAAEQRNGSIAWNRADDRTHFQLTIPGC